MNENILKAKMVRLNIAIQRYFDDQSNPKRKVTILNLLDEINEEMGLNNV